MMSNPAVQQLCGLVLAAIQAEERVIAWPHEHSHALQALILKNRLGALLDPVLQKLEGVPENVRRSVSDQSRNIFLAHELRMRDLAHWFPQRGQYPWLMLRGPAVGVSLYGDPVLRPYSDLDLLVSPEFRTDFINELDQSGFNPPTNAWPDGFFFRHHFHLQRMRVSGPQSTMVEVHWAFDHKWNFRQPTPEWVLESSKVIRLAGIEVPVPEDGIWWQLLAHHLGKHLPDLPEILSNGEEERIVDEGELLHLLDLMLLLPRVSVEQTLDDATCWGGERICLTVLHAIDRLFPGQVQIKLPPLPPANRRSRVHAPTVNNVNKYGVFRLGRLPEVVCGIFPRKEVLQIASGGASVPSWVSHVFKFGTAAVFAAAETLFHLGISGVKKLWP